MSEITRHRGCRQVLATIKQPIETSQSRAVLAVNAELLNQPTVAEIKIELAQGNGGIPSND
ncbi:hypothetical protein LOY33_05535 [Pseudomonas sp. B21-036]|uniref:hypothetical protein n=1 Tax=Pseudomonas sp. B21-036 TaxID=2895485 RepID=UPI002160706C|nr:hypothetical protein [Pseudomonas sp. B21-036]UVL52376.1 hypothetical protein LOY33_05535 [Pseudomonas sp. B21-036]